MFNIGTIKDLGIADGIGVLVGIVLVSYIKPTETGGVAILILLPTIVSMAIGGIINMRRDKSDGRNTGTK